jgi:endonuclease YncB( thermonuclease family)
MDGWVCRAFRILLVASSITCIPAFAAIIEGRVVGVSDGDTITVLDSDKRQHKVRLSGIDAPEKSQPYGDASKKNLSRLVYLKDVRVESHKQDRYGRTLGKVWVRPAECARCGLTLGEPCSANGGDGLVVSPVRQRPASR